MRFDGSKTVDEKSCSQIAHLPPKSTSLQLSRRVYKRKCSAQAINTMVSRTASSAMRKRTDESGEAHP